MPSPTEATSAMADEKSAEALAGLSMKELASVLVKHYGLTKGRYDILVEFQIGVGAVGPSEQSRIPGAMIGISKIGLKEIAEGKPGGPAVVNAAEINGPTVTLDTSHRKRAARRKERTRRS